MYDLEALAQKLAELERATRDLAQQIDMLMAYAEAHRSTMIQSVAASEDLLGTNYEVSALAKRRQNATRIHRTKPTDF